jgi:hypothetical protein
MIEFAGSPFAVRRWFIPDAYICQMVPPEWTCRSGMWIRNRALAPANQEL